MNNPYVNMVGLPNHQSSKYPPMPRPSRAAQFSPFAALTGYDEATREVARVTDKKVELGDDIKEKLNERLCIIQASMDQKPEVSITYFQQDHLKEGGTYLIASGYIKKIDQYEGLLVMACGKRILVSDIIDIELEYR